MMLLDWLMKHFMQMRMLLMMESLLKDIIRNYQKQTLLLML